jgi:sialic acid synthase SpsE
MALLARRSIVAARNLPAGHRIEFADLAFKRPGTGLLPYRTAEVVGRRLRAAVGINQPIQFDALD